MNYNEKFLGLSGLPKTLKNSEINEYFEKYKLGDEEAKKKIIMHNIRLVLYRVNNRFFNTPFNANELTSIGIIGLTEAVDTFDANKGSSFSTYAIKCIDNKILMFIRKEKKYIFEVSLNQILTEDKNGSQLSLEDTIYDDKITIEDDYELKESYQILRYVIETLPDRKKEIIKLYYGFIDNKRYTQREIANKFNISRSNVATIISQTLKEIKNKFEDPILINIYQNENKEIVTNEVLEIDKKESDKMPRKITSIYEYWEERGYSREQVEVMLTKLTEKNWELLRIAYGDDLDNPKRGEGWNVNVKTRLYNFLMTKMKKILDENINPEIKKDVNKKELKKNETTKKSVIKNTVDKDICNTMLELLTNDKLIIDNTKLSPKERIIIYLRLGYINGQIYSNKAIANFLNIEVEEVIKTTKDYLNLYRSKVNEVFDETVEKISNEKLSSEGFTRKFNKN